MTKNFTSKLLVKALLSLMSLAFLSISFLVLYRIIKNISLNELISSVNSIKPLNLIIALILCIVNYLIMVGYDWIGLRYAGSKISFRKIAFASFVGDTLNNNLGLSALVGSTIKFRFYSHWGEKPGVIARAIGFYTIGYWMGFAVLTSLSLLCYVPQFQFLANFNSLIRNVLSLILIIPVLFFIIMLFQKKNKNISLGKFKLGIPSLFHGISILAVGILDWACTGILFYLLMPLAPLSNMLKYISIYTISHLTGMVSQVPGGIAVFESVAILMNQGSVCSNLVASLLLFRVVFFILPFFIGLTGFIFFEFKTGKKLFYRFFFRGEETAKS